MGILDSLKGLLKGRKKTIQSGLDKAGKFAHDKVPDKYDDKVDAAVDKAKEVVDKLPD